MTININPRAFLDVVTHGHADDAWCTFVPDIEQAKGREGRWGWFGARFFMYDDGRTPMYALNEQNAYYSLGLLRPPAEGESDRRMLDRWAAGTVVVLDDVGEKTVDAGKVRDELGEPTFIIQTSVNSYQWGYVLEKPVTDLLQMSRLQKALTLRYYPSGKDPGHERAIQYLRLPFGVNNKAARVAENGGKPFPVRLVEWRPELRYDVLDIMTALGDAWSAACTAITSVSAQGVSGAVYTDKEMDGYYRTDPVFRAFKEAGMVDESRVNNGYVGVTCPWADGHSINDDSAGYNPRERNFKCFHSHPEGTPADLHAWFTEYLPSLSDGQTYKALRHKLVADQFAAHPLDVGEEQVHVPGVTLKTLEPLAALALSTQAARKSICSHLARGEVTYRIGEPAAGKSAIALAYALAIATEKPKLIGERSLKRTGGVVILSNEDTRAQYAKRMRAWLDHHDLGVADLLHVVYTPNVNGSYVITADDSDVVSLHPDMEWLSDAIRGVRSTGGDVALVIVDTQAATFHRVEENDNGAMGQAMSLLAQWAEANNVAVEVIHHTPKPQKGWDAEVDLFSARGASAAGASVRNAVGLARLKQSMRAKLPEAEQGKWAGEHGVKSNHGPKMPRKYWYREIVNVTVDLGEVDEDGNMLWDVEGQPVYVYKAEGPVQPFDPNDANTLLRVIVAVRDGEDGGEPETVLKVRAPNGGGAAPSVLAETAGWTLADAKAAVDAAEEHGYIIARDWKNPKTRRDIRIWAPTDEGRAFIAAQAEAVLTGTDDEAGATA